MAELYEELGLTPEEYQRIIEILGREPNKVELGMFSVMWSEHCSYKSSRRHLKRLPVTGPRMLVGPGENAGVVDIGNGMAAVFKLESHNHPSAVEPFQGAATGVGGMIRDIFTMGARPIVNLDPLRFGPIDKPRTRYLLEGVVAGISSYGNRLGIPTIAGDLYFEDAYEDNPLVNVMSLGIMPHEKLVLGRASEPGSIGILIGASTGRDGIGGASVLASQEFDETTEETRPSVQAGDPFIESLEIEACLEMLDRELVLGLQDLGAAGLTCATSETAARGGCGMDVDISSVPLREQGMEPIEIMMSESQERMFAIVSPSHVEEVLEICRRWELDATPVATVTQGDSLRLFHDGEIVAEVPASALVDGIEYDREAERPAYLDEVQAFDAGSLPVPRSLAEVLITLLGSPNICSRRWVYEQYDHMAGVGTVVLPGSDAGVVRVKGTSSALALSCDCNGRYCYLDPRMGAMIAVAESARNVVASGAKPIAATNCLNFGSPEKREIFWQFTQAIDGIAEACRALEAPIVGGNVSFYNESFGEAIYPTPVLGMLGLIEAAECRLTSAFSGEGHAIVLLGTTNDEFGGSEYMKVIHDGMVLGTPPQLDLSAEKAMHSVVLEAAAERILRSAHDLSEGGLAVALAESCIQGGIGASVRLSGTAPVHVALFSESQSRMLVSLMHSDLERLESIAADAGVPYEVIGETGGRELSFDGLFSLSLPRMEDVYANALERMLDVRTQEE